MSGPYQVTRQLEHELCQYTGARYAVALNSGTAAILLSCEWHFTRYWQGVPSIPKKTYASVPMAIRKAGADRVHFHEEDWRGTYQLKPYPIWDSARRFTSGMYKEGQFQCVSFAAAKILGAEQGGAILHDNAQADAWFRRMRFDGRTEGVDPLKETFDLVGHHCLMIPSIAATLVVRLHHLPKHNEDLGFYEYPDLSIQPAFK